MSCVMVAVDRAVPKFDRLYTYKVPEALLPYARRGARVLVPFGRGAPRSGLILKEDALPPEGGEIELKELIDIERGERALTPELVELIFFLRETAFCTYAEALKTVMPKSGFLIANESGMRLKALKKGHLETVYEYREQGASPRLTEKQRAVTQLIKNDPKTLPQILQALGVSRAVVEGLVKREIVERSERVKSPSGSFKAGERPRLTPGQLAAVKAIESLAFDGSKPDTTLLCGVTSSGKTLVYTELIYKTVEKGGSALVLVPEIVLATQMIARLRALFGERVGVIHSALADGERRAQWERIKSGEYDVIVGARSAVFAPAKNLSLIIIDEEQEGSYLSEQSPRYDARAAAVFRAKRSGAQLLLASATPSVESYYKAKQGLYNLVGLSERYGGLPLPEVRVVDMREELLAGNSHYISQALKEAVDLRLKRGEQAILLLNRRGYRPLSMCGSCKKIVKCPSCDSPLVIHKKRGCYLCHYCGGAYPINEFCEDCGGKIKHTGIGTQKIEEELEALFPEARILRMDVDAVSRKGEAERLLARFGRGEYDMIIGTQMIAKGLDFPKVTLAGVLNIDSMLLMPSFRARERAFAMLTQVVGRSGRGERPGEALIQTIDAENPLIALAAAQDYVGFYEGEIAIRKAHLYPPFCLISSVGFLAEKQSAALAASEEFAHLAEEAQREKYPAMPIRILGPAPMRVAYISKLFRYRVVFKSRGDAAFRSLLREAAERWEHSERAKGAKMFIDYFGELEN
ncbi:MAG: primosomal protein N' [Oscillospiraceae bacterium]|nr:primosomal protein N' [Oscillospiraceae bacterium]